MNLYCLGSTNKHKYQSIMTNQLKTHIEALIQKYSQGDVLIERLILTKLSLRGIRMDSLKDDSPADPALLVRLSQVECELDKVFSK